MKKFIGLMAFSLASLSAFTQETFVKLYPEGETTTLPQISQASDGNLFMGGYYYADDTSSTIYMKTDLTGTIIWQHLIHHGGSPKFFHEDADGNYWMQYMHTVSGRYYLRMLELNSEGDSISSVEYPFSMTASDYYTTWLPDGSSATLWYVTPPPMGVSYSLFTRQDASGNLTFADTLSQYDPIHLRFLDLINADGTLFAERTTVGWPWEIHAFDILKMDAFGNATDSVNVDSIYASRLLPVDDGFIICGYYDDTTDHTFYGDDRLKIERYDNDMHLVWSVMDTILYHLSYTKLAGTDDGGFLTISQNYLTISGSGDIRVKKYSGDGVVQWSSVINNENRLRPTKTIELDDHRFAMTGGYTSLGPSPGPEFGLLIMTDTLCRLNGSRISGRVFYDTNENELSDSTDIGIPEQIVVTDPGPFYGVSDAEGNYFIDVYEDTITYHVSTTPPDYFYQSYPDTPFYQIVNIDTCWSYDSVDFAENVDVEVQDMVIDLHNYFLSIGHPVQYDITVTNAGSIPVFGAGISLQVPDMLTLDSVSLPYDSYIDNTIIWTLDTLALFSDQQIHVYMTVPADSALLDSTVMAIATAEPIVTDITPLNNIDSSENIIVGAWDPNHKSVEPAGETESGFIDPFIDALTYTIDFQNTGNYPAEFVTLVDTIDENLNLSSIEMISASHEYTMEFVFPNIVKWHFDHINLPDSGTNWLASQGYVKFKMELQPGLPEMTTIENTAGIYFDFNPVVLTNTVINTLDHTNAVENIPALSNTLVYPNPAASVISFTGISGDASVRIFDMSGKLMLIKHITGVDDVMDISTLASGIYQIAIINGNNEYTSVRLVKL